MHELACGLDQSSILFCACVKIQPEEPGPPPSKTDKMYSRVGALIPLWALLFRCSCGAGDGLTIQQVQDSRLWKDERTTLVLIRTGLNSTQLAFSSCSLIINIFWPIAGFLPDCYLKALEKATSGSNVATIKVYSTFLLDVQFVTMYKQSYHAWSIHVQVACQTEGDKDVCPEYLTDTYVAVRVDGMVKELDANYNSEQEFVTSVLE